MSKRKPTKKVAGVGTGGLNRQLGRADQAINDDELEVALEILIPLSKQHPNNYDAWAMLFEVYQMMRLSAPLWTASKKLVDLRPGEPDILFNLITVAMMNQMFFNGLDYANEFLRRFPDNANAATVKQYQKDLETATTAILDGEGTEKGITPEDFRLLEESRVALNAGDYSLSAQLSEQVLERSPKLIAPRNNLSLAYALQGQFDKAIEVTQQVLSEQPENIHALSNLAQLLVRSGQRDTARPIIERLKTQAADGDGLIKQLEALSYFGDDAAVTASFERAEAGLKAKDSGREASFLYHLAAVAYARQGNVKRARQLWRLALKREPDFELAQDNLDNLDLPVGLRSAAFAFSFNQWIVRTWANELLRIGEKNSQNDAAFETGVRAWLKQNPAIERVLPTLFERGDEACREFALRVASASKLPILKDFALGENGTDGERMEAAQAASEAGLLPHGQTVPLLIKGKRQDIYLLDYEITYESDHVKRPKALQTALQTIHDTLERSEFVKAEELSREAIKTYPDEQTFWNYLGVALQGQKRNDEVKSVVEEAYRRFPDYLFARIGVIQLLIKEKKLEEARALIEPIIRQEKFHISEFRAFSSANIDLLLAEKQYEGARTWLEMWAGMDEENPVLDRYQSMLSLPNMLGRMLRLGRE